MATPRKLTAASIAAKQVLGFGPGGTGDGSLPWDVVGEMLGELLRFLASVVQAFAAELREHAASLFAALGWLSRAVLAVALPVAAVVAALVLVCGCCAAARGRPPAAERAGRGGGRWPRRRRAGGELPRRVQYRGGIFSMHPNKPMVG